MLDNLLFILVGIQTQWMTQVFCTAPSYTPLILRPESFTVMSTLVATMSRWGLDLCTRFLATIPLAYLLVYSGLAFQDPSTIEHQQQPSGDHTSEKKRNTDLAESGPMYQEYTIGCMCVVNYYVLPFRIPVLLNANRDLMETCTPCPRFLERKTMKKRMKGGRMVRCNRCLRGRVVLCSLLLARAHRKLRMKGSVTYLIPTDGVKLVIIKLPAKMCCGFSTNFLFFLASVKFYKQKEMTKK